MVLQSRSEYIYTLSGTYFWTSGSHWVIFGLWAVNLLMKFTFCFKIAYLRFHKVCHLISLILHP